MANPTIAYPQVFQVVGQDSATDTLTVQNTGTTTVFISRNPGVNEFTFEHTIGPGGDWTWPAATALFVAVATGQQGQISYGPNGTTVNTGSTYSQGSNQPILIFTATIVVAAGAGTYFLPFTNSTVIGSYSSVLVQINTLSAIPMGVYPVFVANYISMTVSCADHTGNGNGIVYRPQWAYNTQGTGPPHTPYQQSIQIPVTNTNLNIQASVTVLANFAGTITVQVYGTGQTLTIPQYISDGDGFSGSITQGGTFHQNVSAGNSGPFYVATKNGYATLAIYNGNTSTNGYMYLQYIESGALVQFAGVLATGATPGSGPIIQAQFPMRVIVANFIQAAGGSYQATISQ